MRDPNTNPNTMSLYEAKSRFSEVIERVMREGRTITVTRRGIPVADIVPTRGAAMARMTPTEAVAALDAMRDELPQLAAAEIRALVDEGRHA